MTIHNVNFATSYAGLSTPLALAPSSIKRVRPNVVMTAAGYSKWNGKESIEMTWDIADAVVIDDIYDRTGGSAANSIYGWLQIQERVPRSSVLQTYSIYRAYLHQSDDGEIHQGNRRTGMKVLATRLTLVEELAP